MPNDALISFADDFAAKTNSLDVPDIHPMAAAIIWEWLCLMRAAAEADRPREVADWAQKVNDKIALERQFKAENEAAANLGAIKKSGKTTLAAQHIIAVDELALWRDDIESSVSLDAVNACIKKGEVD
jgi:hypothetical protein